MPSAAALGQRERCAWTNVAAPWLHSAFRVVRVFKRLHSLRMIVLALASSLVPGTPSALLCARSDDVAHVWRTRVHV